MSRSNAIVHQKLLIVEGNHEYDFFTAWLNHMNISDVQVMPIGGKTQLRDNLVALVKQRAFPSVTSMIVVRDADENPAAALQSVQDSLQHANLPRPSDALTLTQNTTPAVGIIIVPAIGREGALEELLIDTVVSDPLINNARQFIEASSVMLTQLGHRPGPPRHRKGKAVVHAYLATFEFPDRNLGTAARTGVWDFEHPALDPILQLLRLI